MPVENHSEDSLFFLKKKKYIYIYNIYSKHIYLDINVNKYIYLFIYRKNIYRKNIKYIYSKPFRNFFWNYLWD